MPDGDDDDDASEPKPRDSAHFVRDVIFSLFLLAISSVVRNDDDDDDEAS